MSVVPAGGHKRTEGSTTTLLVLAQGTKADPDSQNLPFCVHLIVTSSTLSTEYPLLEEQMLIFKLTNGFCL